MKRQLTSSRDDGPRISSALRRFAAYLRSIRGTKAPAGRGTGTKLPAPSLTENTGKEEDTREIDKSHLGERRHRPHE